MVLVLHGVVDAVALPHQVVVSAQNGGINFVHIYVEQSCVRAADIHSFIIRKSAECYGGVQQIRDQFPVNLLT